AKSDDGGETWSEAKVIADKENVDDRNVAIAELPNGDLLVNYNTYTEEAVSQAMFIRSGDGGETWSAPRPLPVPDSRTKSSAKVLSNGWILIPLYLDPGRAAVAAISKDDGETWEGITLSNTEGFVGDEWDLIEPEPGRLIGLSRNDHEERDRFIYKFESHDYGMTWETPVKTNIQTGRHAAPIQLFYQNGVPTVIYPDQRMVSVSAIFTRDPEYLEWNLDQALPCYVYNEDRSPIPDGSYTVSAPTGANERLIVDYEIREQSKRVTGYFVEFPEDWGEE
ncbi:MAG: exo-alpha-sialidase, partial [Candidatus Omnitrophica bacterium]|nr:exo-alpha-sialidase [Candidatus Omnitrophota bacterium]